MSYSRWTLGALVACGALYLACRTTAPLAHAEPMATTPPAATPAVATGRPEPTNATFASAPATPTVGPVLAAPAGPLPAPVEKALDWLAGAQQQDGGWGAGSHARQDVRDAHAVSTDPATTAVAAMALLRSGNALDHGAFAATLAKATEYLLGTVERAADDGPQITAQAGTQPQAKMGANVDTALTAQYLARLLQDLGSDDALRPRVAKALDKCVRKIEFSQNQDGSQRGGSWAPVLQSAQGCTALELAQAAGRAVDADKLAQARQYQRGLAAAAAPGAAAVPVGGSGAGPGSSYRLSKDAAAGIELYAAASNMRGVAADAKAAEELVEAAKRDGKLPADARPAADTLQQLGVDGERAQALVQAFTMNNSAKVRAFDERVLDGFGNNGGEEFLSYQMKGEALVIDGGEEWPKWRVMMTERLAKVQNQDGSWSGHHCITSPTFCTATAICCLTADRDAAWLKKASALAAK